MVVSRGRPVAIEVGACDVGIDLRDVDLGAGIGILHVPLEAIAPPPRNSVFSPEFATAGSTEPLSGVSSGNSLSRSRDADPAWEVSFLSSARDPRARRGQVLLPAWLSRRQRPGCFEALRVLRAWHVSFRPSARSWVCCLRHSSFRRAHPSAAWAARYPAGASSPCGAALAVSAGSAIVSLPLALAAR